MTIDELDALILGGVNNDWRRLSPPFAWGRLLEDGGADHVQTHDERIVLTSNVDIAIEWGLTRRSDSLAERHLWSEKAGFADPATQRSLLADVLYKGELVDRFYLVYVDGGRAYFPSPRNTRADQEDVTGTFKMPSGTGRSLSGSIATRS